MEISKPYWELLKTYYIYIIILVIILILSLISYFVYINYRTKKYEETIDVLINKSYNDIEKVPIDKKLLQKDLNDLLNLRKLKYTNNEMYYSRIDGTIYFIKNKLNIR
jgi:hypothetical protein